MKVLVVGAAGETGRAVAERAVKEGHDVTAFALSAGSYDVPGAGVRAGDATDMAAMEAAIIGQDAVIDTVGGKTLQAHRSRGERGHDDRRGDAAARRPPARRHGDVHPVQPIITAFREALAHIRW